MYPVMSNEINKRRLRNLGINLFEIDYVVMWNLFQKKAISFLGLRSL